MFGRVFSYPFLNSRFPFTGSVIEVKYIGGNTLMIFLYGFLVIRHYTYHTVIINTQKHSTNKGFKGLKRYNVKILIFL